MIATRKNTPPCRVLDANGLEWPNIRWVNLETGEAEQCLLDERGHKYVVGFEIATHIVKLATPVLLKPIKPGER